MLHMDIVGPIGPVSKRHNNYLLVIVGDHYNFLFVKPLKFKMMCNCQEDDDFDIYTHAPLGDEAANALYCGRKWR